jgi:hypothetical protein
MKANAGVQSPSAFDPRKYFRIPLNSASTLRTSLIAMPISDDQPDSTPEPLPQLTEDLAALYDHTPGVAAEVDAAIMAAARAAFGRQRRFRLLLRWGGGVAAAAALVLLAVRIAGTFHPTGGPLQEHPTVAFAREDILHHGRVDILDAFYLARQIQRHAKPQAAWDINQDGVVDQKDVDAIAAAAVRVGDAQGKGVTR